MEASWRRPDVARKPLRMPFAPSGLGACRFRLIGDTPDIAARLTAPKMGKLLHQPITAETQVGAEAIIGNSVGLARPRSGWDSWGSPKNHMPFAVGPDGNLSALTLSAVSTQGAKLAI